MTGLDRLMQDIVREAGAMLRNAHLRASEIHEKEGPANYCTDYDLRIQRFLMCAPAIYMRKSSAWSCSTVI